MSKPINACLFCGSRTGNDPEFAEMARELGETLADRGHTLVYGAGDLGLMGEAARAAKDAGGRVVGVIPQHLMDIEVGKTDLDECIVTKDMHERKMTMFERSDAVIALPGGPGTLDELMEVLTWRQLGLHDRPVVLVNPQRYWDPLISMLHHTVEHGFADESFLSYLSVMKRSRSAVEQMERMLDK